MKRIKTRNSTYLIDEENKRVKREDCKASFYRHHLSDGEWHEYTDWGFDPDQPGYAVFIGDGWATSTSTVTSYEDVDQ